MTPQRPTPLAINFFLFRKWLNLIPFYFTSINGHKTQDHISQSDWNILKIRFDMFHHPLPRFGVPSNSIHVDCGAHVSFHDATIASQLLILETLGLDTPGLLPLS
jgi:hypothetical protein